MLRVAVIVFPTKEHVPTVLTVNSQLGGVSSMTAVLLVPMNSKPIDSVLLMGNWPRSPTRVKVALRLPGAFASRAIRVISPQGP